MEYGTKETYTVSVLQFMLPDGRPKITTTELPIETEALFDKMILDGYHFEAELLTNGMVSTTISDTEDDLDQEVTENDPDVQAGMARMLKRKAWTT